MAKDLTFKRCKCRGDDGKEVGQSCPKLRRADGSWNPRHGTWYFSLELPAGPGGKRRPRLRRGGFATRDDAVDELDRARTQIKRGADPSLRLTTGAYLVKWLADRPDLKSSTRHNYEAAIDTYLVPLLGHIELGRLQAEDIAAMFTTIRGWNEKLAAGEPVRKSQRHVGPTAMLRIRAVLRVALNDAVDSGKRDFNPAERKRVRMETPEKWKPLAWTGPRVDKFWAAHRRALEATKMTRGDKAWRCWRAMKLRPAPSMVWTPEQAAAFLDHAKGDRLAPVFELVMLTGIRRGEACGLSWEHVDLDAGTLTLAGTRVQVAWKVEEATPKSEAGWRTIHLDRKAVALLRHHKAKQAAGQLQWGDAWQGTGLVFTLEDGRPPHPDLVTTTFERLAFTAHLPPVRLHDLRHGWATYALAAGVDVKIVQDRLGHSSSKVTRDLYTTVLEEVSREAAETVSELITRARRSG